jgi:hypothetical protein
MKKYTYLFAAATLLLFAGSCRKTFTCECTVFSMSGKEYTEIKQRTLEKAQAKCAALNGDPATDGRHNCHVTN